MSDDLAWLRSAKPPAVVLTLPDELHELPSELRPFRHIKRLRLAGTQVTSLPQWIGEWECLEVVEAEGAELRILPEALGSLGRLHTLSLAGCPIEVLPKDMDGLQNLCHLDIGSMKRKRLSVVPDSFGNLSALELADFAGSSLSALPEDLSGLERLKTLSLDNARFAEFPVSVVDLKLSSLSLSHNELRDLPSSVLKMSALRRLDLRHNQIASLDPALGSLQGLREGRAAGYGGIWVEGNPIRSLPNELRSVVADL